MSIKNGWYIVLCFTFATHLLGNKKENNQAIQNKEVREHTMEYKIITQEEIKLIGKEIVTTNVNGTSAKDLPAFWSKFLQENTTEKIPNKIIDPNSNQPTLLGVYSNYQADGSYSVTIGALVNSFKNVPSDMVQKTIPSTKYAVFTAKGPIATKIHEVWNHIWTTKFDFERSYIADFELYNERSNNPEDAIVDIYVSIN